LKKRSKKLSLNWAVLVFCAAFFKKRPLSYLKSDPRRAAIHAGKARAPCQET
jgi:hypothetical protein